MAIKFLVAPAAVASKSASAATACQAAAVVFSAISVAATMLIKK
jgi:hypothetical protein